MKCMLAVSVIVMVGLVTAAEANVLSAPGSSAAAVKAAAEQSQKVACGSRGGPGYRKANGKCASWRR